jgi:hypothetical protein
MGLQLTTEVILPFLKKEILLRGSTSYGTYSEIREDKKTLE